MWETILKTVVTVLVTLIITLLFNGFINLPKRKKKREEDEAAEQEALRNEILEAVNKSNDKIYDELRKQSQFDKETKEDLKLCKLGLQTVVKYDLKTLYEKSINKGYASIETKDELERMYQVYHSLGANGVMDGVRAKFMSLPESRPTKKRD